MRRLNKGRACLWIGAVLCGCVVMANGFFENDTARGNLFPEAEAAEQCFYDYAPDGDVDGMDLAAFVQQFIAPGLGGDKVAAFALKFGSTGCTSCTDFLPCDVVKANDCFEALLSEREDPTANVFNAVTRILALLYDPAVNALLDNVGVGAEVRELCNWTAGWAEDPQGDIILPDPLPPTGDAISILTDVLLPQVEGALENLAGIDDSVNEPFIILCEELQLPDDVLPCEPIEVDYGDVALYRSMLQAAKAFILIVDAYDLNVADTAGLVEKMREDLFVLNDYLCKDPGNPDCLPNFMTLEGDAGVLLAEAKGAVRDAIASYTEASDFIRGETDNQEDDLVSIAPEEMAEEERFRNVLHDDILCALDQTCRVDGEKIDYPFDLNLTQFFDDPIDLRANLPIFTGTNDIVCGSFSDPTFSGLLPGFDNDTLANRLHLTLPVTGTVTCSNYTSGDIFVGAFRCDGDPGDPPELGRCDQSDAAALTDTGTYALELEADDGEVGFFAFWDQDGDEIFSPGDYYGFYPGNPIEVLSSDCAGPGAVNIDLSEQVIGIKGRITQGGQPVPHARVGVFSYASQCGGQVDFHDTNANDNGYFAINGLDETPQYVRVGVSTSSSWDLGWWKGDNGFGLQCDQAVGVIPGPGTAVINIDLP